MAEIIKVTAQANILVPPAVMRYIRKHLIYKTKANTFIYYYNWSQ